MLEYGGSIASKHVCFMYVSLVFASKENPVDSGTPKYPNIQVELHVEFQRRVLRKHLWVRRQLLHDVICTFDKE